MRTSVLNLLFYLEEVGYKANLWLAVVRIDADEKDTTLARQKHVSMM